MNASLCMRGSTVSKFMRTSSYTSTERLCLFPCGASARQADKLSVLLRVQESVVPSACDPDKTEHTSLYTVAVFLHQPAI